MDVPATSDNVNLHRGLGALSIPFGNIYHPTGGLVEESKISKKYFAKFARVLNTYIEGQFEIEDIPFE